jgi:hypothetical protein
LIIKILSSKDLRGSTIAILNSILSARLICVLDLIFAETTLTDRCAWLADCWPTPIPVASFLLDHESSRCRERSSPRAKKIKSPAFDNVHSVPVQAA